MKKLQNVIFPDQGFRKSPLLFYRLEERPGIDPQGKTKRITRLSFDTYMNAFAINTWRKYTSIKNFALYLKFKGRSTVYIYNSFLRSYYYMDEELIIKKDLSSDGRKPIKLSFRDTESLSLVHFELEYDSGSSFQLLEAYWGPDEPVEQRDISLAIVCCTFKREKYVHKNVELFTSFITTTPELKNSIDYFIIDNGQTLENSIKSKNVHLFSNRNTGGVGGFTRGLIEALRSTKKYTHVLFMDDDVEIFPESFYRTYMLLKYVRGEYDNAFIHGSMFRMDRKHVLFESLAYLDDLWVTHVHGKLNMNRYRNVLVNNKIDDSIFKDSKDNQKYVDSAWWYCCIPLKYIDLHNLPVPVFIRGDDVEYSLRFRGIHHIVLNGICVWHEPFEFRVNKVMEIYFLIRNMPFVNMIYRPGSKSAIIIAIIKRFLMLWLSYDYSGVEMLLTGLNEFLKGPKWFYEDNFGKIQNLKSLSESFQPVSNKKQVDLIKKSKLKMKKLDYFILIITAGGLLLPKFLYKKHGISPYRVYPGVKNFLLTKKVIMIDEKHGRYSVREIRKLKSIVQLLKMTMLLLKYTMKYKSLRKRYTQTIKEVTDITFWDNYLGLSNSGNIKK